MLINSFHTAKRCYYIKSYNDAYIIGYLWHVVYQPKKSVHKLIIACHNYGTQM